MRVTRCIVAAVCSVAMAVPASAAPFQSQYQANPWIFVGKTGDCGTVGQTTTPYPPGSRIVTSAWLGGMGLPDNGGPNTGAGLPFNGPGGTIALADLAAAPDPGTRNDPHRGLLLSKNGPTADCSSAGATINNVRNLVVPATGLELGFDYRNGGHCGAGAPRFNVVARPSGGGPNTFHFVGGCANGAKSPAPQDPAQWTRVRFNTSDPGQSFPVIPPGSRIVSINLVFDEGTDSTSAPDDPNGVGLAVVDNIDIGGQLITGGVGVADGSTGPQSTHRNGDDDDNGDNGNHGTGNNGRAGGND